MYRKEIHPNDTSSDLEGTSSDKYAGLTFGEFEGLTRRHLADRKDYYFQQIRSTAGKIDVDPAKAKRGYVICFTLRHHIFCAVYRYDGVIALFDSCASSSLREAVIPQLTDFAKRVSPEHKLLLKYNTNRW